MMKRLESEGKIERIPIDRRTVRETIDIAERDLRAAEMNLAISNEWAYNIASTRTRLPSLSRCGESDTRPRTTSAPSSRINIFDKHCFDFQPRLRR